MACHIIFFLKSLGSVEEFRKNHHVKIPPKPLLQISKALINSNPILIRKFLFFLIFGPPTRWPAWPLAQPAHRLHRPRRPNRPAGPSSPRVGRVFAGNTFSSLVHAFPSRPPPPRFSDKRAPAISSVPHLQPPELAHAATDSRPLSAAQLRASGAVEPLQPRLHFPSLNSPP
jgi:hypothetical protein